MNTKTLVWIGMAIGSTVGGYIPSIWGSGIFSMSSIFFSAVGAITGIYAGYKLGQ